MTTPIILEPYSTETIAPGVIRNWSADRRLALYTLNDIKRPTIDTWVDSVKTMALAWPSGEPIRICYETLTVGNPQMATYIGTRMREINDLPFTASKVYAAFAFPNPILVGVARVIGMSFTLGTPNRVPVITEAFSDRDKAIQWLITQPD
jgi:hypothetical protein